MSVLRGLCFVLFTINHKVYIHHDEDVSSLYDNCDSKHTENIVEISDGIIFDKFLCEIKLLLNQTKHTIQAKGIITYCK